MEVYSLFILPFTALSPFHHRRSGIDSVESYQRVITIEHNPPRNLHEYPIFVHQALPGLLAASGVVAVRL